MAGSIAYIHCFILHSIKSSAQLQPPLACVDYQEVNKLTRLRIPTSVRWSQTILNLCHVPLQISISTSHIYLRKINEKCMD